MTSWLKAVPRGPLTNSTTIFLPGNTLSDFTMSTYW